MSTRDDEIRRQVAEEYGRAVSRGGGCCGAVAGGCGTGTAGRSVVTAMAGYRAEELAAAPPEAVASSFACGNPVALAEIGPGETVLDLGSGAGLDLVLAARRVGPSGRVIGVDMTEEMVERARASVAAAGLGNVEVRRGLIEELPVDDASVDWVISNCVVNLSPEKERVFAGIARVLRPGGRMLVSDIVADGLPDWVLGNPALYCACIAGAVSEERYLAGLRAAGLVDVEVRGRHVYEAAQIRAFIDAELLGRDTVPQCDREGFLTDALAGRIAGLVAGKVASVRFFARKP